MCPRAGQGGRRWWDLSSRVRSVVEPPAPHVMSTNIGSSLAMRSTRSYRFITPASTPGLHQHAACETSNEFVKLEQFRTVEEEVRVEIRPIPSPCTQKTFSSNNVCGTLLEMDTPAKCSRFWAGFHQRGSWAGNTCEQGGQCVSSCEEVKRCGKEEQTHTACKDGLCRGGVGAITRTSRRACPPPPKP